MIRKLSEFWETLFKKGWDKKVHSLSVFLVVEQDAVVEWALHDFISFTQLCGGGTTKSNSTIHRFLSHSLSTLSVDSLATIFHRGDSRLHGLFQVPDKPGHIGAV